MTQLQADMPSAEHQSTSTPKAEPETNPYSVGQRWSILWSMTKPQWKILVIGLLLGLVTSALSLATPMATKWILDSLAEGLSMARPVSLLVVLLIVGGVVGWLQWYLLGAMAEDVVFTARKHMMRRFVRAKVSRLSDYSPGELVTRVTSDSVLLREAASSSIIGIINGIVLLVGTIALMAWLDSLLTAVTVVLVVIVAVVIGLLMPLIAKLQEKAQAALSDLGGQLEGTIRAVKTVKVANQEEPALTGLNAAAHQARDFGVKAVRREALVWTIAGVGIQGAIIAILAIGAWRVSEDAMTVSTLVAFLLYAFGLAEPVSSLGENFITLQSGLAAAGRIQQVNDIALEQDPDKDSRNAPDVSASAEVPGGPARTPALLELDNVTVAYGTDKPAILENFSLAIPAPGHTALVGFSGAGKTTIMSLLLRFVDPVAGELRLNGTPYPLLSNHAVRSHIAYVEQEAPLIPGTLRTNLLIGNDEVSPETLADTLTMLRLDALIGRLEQGLDTPVTNTSVSGGERQRIAVARALLRKPDILLMDEATSQVDALTEAAIRAAVSDFSRTGAVVSIAHRLSTVVHADNIVVLDKGRIMEQGTHEQLLATEGLYRDMVKSLAV